MEMNNFFVEDIEKMKSFVDFVAEAVESRSREIYKIKTSRKLNLASINFGLIKRLNDQNKNFIVKKMEVIEFMGGKEKNPHRFYEICVLFSKMNCILNVIKDIEIDLVVLNKKKVLNRLDEIKLKTSKILDFIKARDSKNEE